MIEAGAAGVHFEDQLSSEKKCGHLGGKVLVPTASSSARSSPPGSPADVLDVPTLVVARTDALSATLLTSDVDETDAEFVHGRADARGLLPRPRRARVGDRPRARLRAVRRPDLVRDLDAGHRARRASSPRRCTSGSPGKLFAYNCSPSFNWRQHLDDAEIASFRETLAELGYRYQFVTLAGFHSLNAGMFELARGYASRGHARLRRAPGARVRARGARLHRDPPPARGRRRLLRPAWSRPSPADRASTLALTGSTEASPVHRDSTEEERDVDR